MTRWQRFWDSNGGRALGAGLLVGALVFVVFVPVAAPFLKGLKTALVMSLGMTGMVLLGGGMQAGMRSAARGGCAWVGFASFVTDNWARSVVVSVVLALTVFGVKKAVVAVKGAGAKVPPPSSPQAPSSPNGIHDVQVIDASEVQHLFTSEAWAIKQGLPKNALGETMSNMMDGTRVHKGFMVGGKASVKGGGPNGGFGHLDGTDFSTSIYELKANNAKQIALGKKQLIRYQRAWFNQYNEWLKMILVKY